MRSTHSDQRLERPRRPDPQSLRARPQYQRLQLRLRRGHRRQPGDPGDRHRDRRLDRLAVLDLRHRRHQADPGPGQPQRHHPDRALAGHGRPDDPQRGRRRPAAGRDRRRRRRTTPHTAASRRARRPITPPALRKDGLQGKRIGVARNFFGSSPAIDAVIEAELAILKAQGATLVDVERAQQSTSTATANWKCCCPNSAPTWKPTWRDYAPHAPVKTMADVIAFNEQARRASELQHFGQEHLVAAQKKPGLDAKAYREALANNHRYAREEGIDKILRERQARRAGRADRRHRLADRLHQRRPLRRQLLLARGGGRLPARDGAGRLCARPAGRPVLRRRRLERSGA